MSLRPACWQQLVVPVRLPGLNEILAAANKRRGKWNAYAKMKTDLETALVPLCRQQLEPVCYPVHLHFLWQESARRRDLDNIVAGRKFIVDALVKAGILPADGWRWVVGFTDVFQVQKTCAVIVRIEEREDIVWETARRRRKEPV